MKKILTATVAIIILTITLGGCRKVPINGDLDGMWQVMSVEYADGTSHSYSGLYYCVSLHVIQLRGGGVFSGNMIYDKDARTLKADFPGIAPGQLRPWGVEGTQMDFDILELTGKRLTLKSDYAEVRLRKW